MSKKNILILIVFLLLISLGITGYLYRTEKIKSSNPAQLIEENTQKVIDNASELMILPENEKPTIATIIDIEKLRSDNPEFYKNAENGDKLLIYPQKAIIYSEKKNIIINVASIIRQPANDSIKKESE